MKARKLDRTKAANYRGRADEFFRAMSDEAWCERHNAAALLGIHATIALTDAVTIHSVGMRAADEQHRDAAELLRKACDKTGVQETGSDRLGRILSEKNPTAYGELLTATDSARLKSVRLDVERFFTWAYKNFAHLGRMPG